MGKAVAKKRSAGSRSKKSSRRPRRPAAPAPAPDHSYVNECAAVLMLAAGIFVAVALASHYWGLESGAANSMGALGNSTARFLVRAFGWGAFSVPVLLLLATPRVWRMAEVGAWTQLLRLLKASVVFTILLSGLTTLAALGSGAAGGGILGAQIADFLVRYVNTAGAALVSLIVISLMLIAITDLSVGTLLRGLALLAEYVLAGIRVLMRACVESWSSLQQHCAEAFNGIGEYLDERRQDREERRAETGSRFVLGTEGEDDWLAEEEGQADEEHEEEFEEDDYEEDEEGDVEDDEDDDIPEEYDADDLEFDDDEFDDEDFEEFPEFSEEKAEQVKIWRRDALSARSSAATAPAQESRRPLRNYTSPSLDLLVGSDSSSGLGPDDQALIENSRALEEALRNFRIGGRVVEVHPGPVITLYQFAPAPGVKVQRIINLADDLALALKVASVRVYAPVPGKGTVGVEVPNKQREIVRLRDILECEEFRVSETALPLALGKDTYGEPYVAHLPRMPHLLIAGATGTGKSVCINSLLLSLLCKNSPEELNLILIDPKMLELSIYEDIPHLKAPVVTNAKRARGVLWWAVEEMERRYRLLKRVGVRDIAAYNKLAHEGEAPRPHRKKRKNVTIELQERDVIATGSPNEGLDRAASSVDEDVQVSEILERLPRIVVVVDELADLMLSVGREIEDLLARLAQKARAAGIHLILATQRPSVNVITGLIKANFPARISFKVASKIDARTVLDTSGSEKLLGQGDLLFSAPWVGQLKRLHSPYVSDQEVHDVCDWLRTQGEPLYDTSIEQMITKLEENESGGSAGAMPDGQDYDEFYDRAVSLVIEKGQASTSMVQRAFRIGYNRAARILETMEREGIVGPADGAKPRQILVGSMDGSVGEI